MFAFIIRIYIKILNIDTWSKCFYFKMLSFLSFISIIIVDRSSGIRNVDDGWAVAIVQQRDYGILTLTFIYFSQMTQLKYKCYTKYLNITTYKTLCSRPLKNNFCKKANATLTFFQRLNITKLYPQTVLWTAIDVLNSFNQK